MTDDENNMFLYVGAYPDETSAEFDYQTLLNLHDQGWVGSYDVGIVTKDNEGKLDLKRHTDSTGKGTRRGLAVGVLLGVIFPPSILASGVIGMSTGAVIGHHFNAISKDDLRQLGDYIENNQAALVVIGESRAEDMVRRATISALKQYKKDFNSDVQEFNEELDQTMKEI